MTGQDSHSALYAADSYNRDPNGTCQIISLGSPGIYMIS